MLYRYHSYVFGYANTMVLVNTPRRRFLGLGRTAATSNLLTWDHSNNNINKKKKKENSLFNFMPLKINTGLVDEHLEHISFFFFFPKWFKAPKQMCRDGWVTDSFNYEVDWKPISYFCSSPADNGTHNGDLQSSGNSLSCVCGNTCGPDWLQVRYMTLGLGWVPPVLSRTCFSTFLSL